jgi:hypothetical protein
MAKTKNHKPEKIHEYNKKENGLNDTGRPEKYTSKYLKNLSAKLYEWAKQPDNYILGEFCFDNGFSLQRLSEFKDVSKEFSEMLSVVKTACQNKLQKNALLKKTDATMTKYILSNHYDWKEKTDVNVDGLRELFEAMRKKYE